MQVHRLGIGQKLWASDRYMSHPLFFCCEHLLFSLCCTVRRKRPIPLKYVLKGVQGPPCRGLGCPQFLLLLLHGSPRIFETNVRHSSSGLKSGIVKVSQPLTWARGVPAT